jgi:hypothetical protein
MVDVWEHSGPAVKKSKTQNSRERVTSSKRLGTVLIAPSPHPTSLSTVENVPF